MGWFIKTEKFTDQTQAKSISERRFYIEKHREWVQLLKSSGHIIYSGYLVNRNHLPGGGGLLILKADSFTQAEDLIKKDPMIVFELVEWEIQEWVTMSKELFN